MEKNKIVQPKTLQGTRDFLPEEMAKRDFVMNIMKSVFMNFGYDTIQTPAIESAETIVGKYGDDATKLMYRFADNDGNDIALRYDHTVSFARLVAAHHKRLPIPFKRYQVGRVWRADRPARGRYREFYQCDIDIIGTDSLLAEAEIAAVISTVFTTLGFSRFLITFNSRRLITNILLSLNVDLQIQPTILRTLDTLEKDGARKVRQELYSFVSKKVVDELLEKVLCKGTTEEKLQHLRKYDTREVSHFLELAKVYGVSERNLSFEPSLTRGLDYYTGLIFEVFIPPLKVGAVCAGGRYDDLCSYFCKEKFSGVGVAFGFDRLVDAMEDLNLLEEAKLNSRVLVTHCGDETLGVSLSVLRDIQQAGIHTEIYFEPAHMRKQLQYADRKDIPFVVVCGPEEIARGEVMIKMMKTAKQKIIPRDQITNYFKGYTRI